MKQISYFLIHNRSKVLVSVTCILFFLMTGHRAACQDDLSVVSHWLQYSDDSNALYHCLADQAYSELGKRDSIISHLTTLADWRGRQKWEKKTLMEIIGPFPGKTALHAEITRRVNEDGYMIEDIIYESQPGFYVTSSLFIPKGLKGKAPAILYCSGHTPSSYRDPDYQQVIINLVKKGFIVFAFDPIGQGERLQYFNKQTGKSTIEQPSEQHAYFGMQAFITGSSLARYMIWDGIRAIDYLLTRKEVDPSRIGITGQSGGGTQCAYIAALDDRIYVSAPSSYITSFKRLIQAIGPQDAEQNLYHEISSGIDQADLLEVRAPKPTLMITTTRDFFPIQGSVETAKEVDKIYQTYGKQADFRMIEDDAPHEWTKKNREAMYAFFQKYLDNPGNPEDIKITPLPDSSLQVTPTGQVSSAFDHAETAYTLNLKDAQKDIQRLQKERGNLPAYLPKILEECKRLSGYQTPPIYHQPVFTGRYDEKGYVIEKHFVKGEGSYVIPYLLLIPENPNGKAVICLNPDGKAAAIKNGDAQWFVKKGFTVIAPDLLGTGEMGRGYQNLRQSTLHWYLAMLVGKSIVGIQAEEVTVLVHVLNQFNHIKQVYGLARGTMCPVMLYAAAFDKNIQRICLIKPLSSYRAMVTNLYYDPRFVDGAVAGSLRYYDLPDIEAALAPRKLTIVDMVNEQYEPIQENQDASDISIVKKGYREKDAGGQFNITYGEPEDTAGIFDRWIK
ncbi:MAG: xylan esterase [Chitinophagaceae bacterium]|nr:MAG: xylan esterase [Chitinophagaceae bacterium]